MASVLVVEDDENLLNLIRESLEVRHTVLIGRNGLEGWRLLEKERVDLVITDIRMPVMDGYEPVVSIN